MLTSLVEIFLLSILIFIFLFLVAERERERAREDHWFTPRGTKEHKAITSKKHGVPFQKRVRDTPNCIPLAKLHNARW